MTYDHWKTTNPADEFSGPSPDEVEIEPEPEERDMNEKNPIFYATEHNCIFAQQDCAMAHTFVLERLSIDWPEGAAEMQKLAAEEYRYMWTRLARLIGVE